MTEFDEMRATLALTEAALKNAQEQRDACAVEALEQRQRAAMLRAALEAVEWVHRPVGLVHEHRSRCPSCWCSKKEEGGDGHDDACVVALALKKAVGT